LALSGPMKPGIAWTVTGSGRAAVLSAAVAAGSGMAAAITISPGLNDPEEFVFAVRLTVEGSRLRMEELGIATDGPDLLRAVTAVRSGPVGTEWSGTLRLAALQELFAGPLVLSAGATRFWIRRWSSTPATPAGPLSPRRWLPGAWTERRLPGTEHDRRAQVGMIVN